MDILFISSNSSSRGGGEDFIIYLSRVFHKFYKNTLFSIYSDQAYMDNFVNSIKEYTTKVVRINYTQLSKRKLRFFSSTMDFMQIFRIYSAINTLKPKLIIINQQYDEDSLDILISSFIYKILNISNSVKIACVMHMPRVRNKVKNQPFGFFRYLYLLIIYGFFKPTLLLTSKECLNEFKQYYFFNKKKSFLIKSPLPNIKENISKQYSLEIINNSIIDESAKNKLNNWYLNKKQIILIGCQMKAQKNPLFALSCWVKLRNVYKSNACLLIIGDGPLKNKLSKKISTLSPSQIEDITQIGWVSDLSRYILISDLLLMPSSFEGMNLTLLECISYNKEIILSKFEGINEIKRFTKCCTQINEFDSALWANKINKILLERLNKKSKNSLNKDFIKHYSDYECFQSFKRTINF
ncbi:MAG: hypothetical protein CL869_00420 [Cytophagia bacterium]|nr:hypothetical protein [Cytophagia bacterium]|tara:strand:+ start:366 stop:1595 length:1230 start_codon:yes stop_codon:yes gene_type:complete